MSRLSVVEWKEEFVRKLAEELENVELAYISDDRVEEYMEMYGETTEGAAAAAEMERESIEAVIASAQDDDEEQGEAADEDDAREPDAGDWPPDDEE